MLIAMSLTNKVYHVFAARSEDGTRLLIDCKNGKNCIFPTSNPYWRKPNSVAEKMFRRGPIKIKDLCYNQTLNTIKLLFKKPTVHIILFIKHV